MRGTWDMGDATTHVVTTRLPFNQREEGARQPIFFCHCFVFGGVIGQGDDAIFVCDQLISRREAFAGDDASLVGAKENGCPLTGRQGNDFAILGKVRVECGRRSGEPSAVRQDGADRIVAGAQVREINLIQFSRGRRAGLATGNSGGGRS